MRVAFVVNAFPTLTETFILDQIAGLIDRGHEVEILANQRRPDTDVHETVDRYRLMDRVVYLDRPGSARARIGGLLGRVIRDPARHLAPAMRSLNGLRYRRRAFTLATFFQALPLLGRDPYDAVICHFGPQGITALDAHEVAGLPHRLLVVFHGADMGERFRIAYRRLFEKAALCLPISRRWHERLLEWGCDPEKLRIHHMGIDCDRFAFRSPPPVDAGPFRIVTIARFVEKKGIPDGLGAVAKLLEDGRAVRYDVVGDGPEAARVREAVGALSLDEQVHLHGWLDRDQVQPLLDRAHVLLAPSVTARDGDQEGIPVAIMEAMAMGVPVVSTVHSGIPELVESGVSGLLAPERDAGALAGHLRRLRDEPGLGPELATAARRKVEAEFDVDRLNDRLVELCRDVASRPAAG